MRSPISSKSLYLICVVSIKVQCNAVFRLSAHCTLCTHTTVQVYAYYFKCFLWILRALRETALSLNIKVHMTHHVNFAHKITCTQWKDWEVMSEQERKTHFHVIYVYLLCVCSFPRHLKKFSHMTVCLTLRTMAKENKLDSEFCQQW